MENSIIGAEGGGQQGSLSFFYAPNGLKINFRHWNFFSCIGDTPLGLLWLQRHILTTKVTKPCQGTCCGQNCTSCSRHSICCSKIWHLKRQKFAFLKVDLSFFENFFKLFGIFNHENTLFKKVLKKLSSFRKKYLYFFHNRGGEGGGTLCGIFHNFFLFF